MTEHALLATTVTRRGGGAARDFAAAAAALNGNTEDIATALDAYYGSTAAPVTAAWRDRISLLADYTVAVAEKRERQARETAAELRRADGRLGKRLDDLSQGHIADDTATSALRALTGHLLDGIDAQSGNDDGGAGSALSDALAAATNLAGVVAEGILAHRPQDFDPQ